MNDLVRTNWNNNAVAGVKKVALLDFDVHHGNGTQACISAVMPSTIKVPLKTPFSEGYQSFSYYRPWLGTEDAHNLLFARYGVFILLRISGPTTC